MKNNTVSIPSYAALIEATYSALRLLDGSGTIKEINEKASELLELDDEILNIPHLTAVVCQKLIIG